MRRPEDYAEELSTRARLETVISALLDRELRARSWDGGAAEKAVKPVASELRKLYAVFRGGNPDVKGSYGYPHHNVNSDGTVGGPNLDGCRTAIGFINAGKGLSQADKDHIYSHCAAHIRSLGATPPAKPGG